jgi:hypothetical protein
MPRNSTLSAITATSTAERTRGRRHEEGVGGGEVRSESAHAQIRLHAGEWEATWLEWEVISRHADCWLGVGIMPCVTECLIRASAWPCLGLKLLCSEVLQTSVSQPFFSPVPPWLGFSIVSNPSLHYPPHIPQKRFFNFLRLTKSNDTNQPNDTHGLLFLILRFTTCFKFFL